MIVLLFFLYIFFLSTVTRDIHNFCKFNVTKQNCYCYGLIMQANSTTILIMDVDVLQWHK